MPDCASGSAMRHVMPLPVSNTVLSAGNGRNCCEDWFEIDLCWLFNPHLTQWREQGEKALFLPAIPAYRLGHDRELQTKGHFFG